MNKEQVPQDQENLNEGKLAKLYYATDEKGHYVKVNSIGWEPETVAMQQAWDVVNDEVEDAREKVIKGKASPLLYYHQEKHHDTRPWLRRMSGTLGLIGSLALPSFFL